MRINPTSSGPPTSTPTTWSSEIATIETAGQPVAHPRTTSTTMSATRPKAR